MTTRGQRVLHGTVAALFSTFVAAFSHAIAGGGAPGALALSLALAFSVVLCTLLSHPRTSVLRLGLSVTLSQAVFHTLFSVFGPISGTASGSHGVPSGATTGVAETVLSTLVTAGHHGTVQGATGTTSGLATVAQSGHSLTAPDATMIVGHVIAAIVTFAALYRGERSLSGLVRSARIALGRLVARRLPQQIVEPATLATHRIEDVRVAPTLVFLGPALRRRGPPVRRLLALSPLG